MGSRTSDYNIPSNNRELQLPEDGFFSDYYYNIPSNNRELQHRIRTYMHYLNYNIPSNNRELQLVRNLSRLIRDYNIPSNNRELQRVLEDFIKRSIITYQVITGNYSIVMKYKSHEVL